MFIRRYLDEDQDRTIVSISDFSREADIVEGFYELDELCFSFRFAYLSVRLIEEGY